MAGTLDDMLEPGERVVTADRGGPDKYYLAFAVGVLGVVVPHGIYLSGSYEPAAWPRIYWLAFIMIMVFLVVFWLLPGHAKAVVTGRRLLYRWRGNTPGKIALDLAEVAEVAVTHSGYMEVTRPDGERLLFMGLRRLWDFAAALARAAGRPEPRPVGRLEWLWPFAATLGIVACAAAVGALYPDLRAGGRSSEAVLAVLGMLGVLTGSFAAGTQIGGLLGLILLRPWVTAGEASAWLAVPRGYAKRGPWRNLHAALLLWHNPLYPWLAGLLWGPAARPGNGEAAGHG